MFDRARDWKVAPARGHSKSVAAPLLAGLWIFLLPGAQAPAASNDYFKITLVDDQTGRGVPLVELSTTSQVRLYTDSQGVIALNEPGLMDQEVYFHVKSHGYEFGREVLGSRGLKLKPTKGASAQIKLKRLNVAERLYRVTGEGIYRDSVLLGLPVPVKHPLLNGQVTGQDTVIATPYRGKLYWFWGDTERLSAVLGNFAVSGATSALPGHGGLDPNAGVDLTYFVDASGFSKRMCPNFGPGLQWLEGIMTVPDEDGKERLVARVSSQKGLTPAYAWHLAVFNDEKEIFESKVRWDIAETHGSSHPFRALVNGVEYLYLYPTWRVKADLKSLSDLDSYEAFTPLILGTDYDGAETHIDRDDFDRVVYGWKAATARLDETRLRELISAGKLKRDEAWAQLHDIKTGKALDYGRGSVFWNDFRRRWIMLTAPRAGEIWFAEADTPVGPWVYAAKVVSHDRYNFYNPTQHPFFDQEGGRRIYFEGTYTASFSGATARTPRYDYNQIMYRLDLADSRLSLPAPVYQQKTSAGLPRYSLREEIDAANSWDSIEDAAFFAIPAGRQREEHVPVFRDEDEHGTGLTLTRKNRPASQPLFYALPANRASIPARLTGRWNCNAITQDGSEISFILDLKLDGETIAHTSDEDGPSITGGSFKAGKLELSLKQDDSTYSLTGTLKPGKLEGTWKKLGSSDEAGLWQGTPAVRDETESPMVVSLYEYRGTAGRARIYSTNADMTDPGLKRSAEPLCRVWRNPMSVLLLDPEAKPVPVLRN